MIMILLPSSSHRSSSYTLLLWTAAAMVTPLVRTSTSFYSSLLLLLPSTKAAGAAFVASRSKTLFSSSTSQAPRPTTFQSLTGSSRTRTRWQKHRQYFSFSSCDSNIHTSNDHFQYTRRLLMSTGTAEEEDQEDTDEHNNSFPLDILSSSSSSEKFIIDWDDRIKLQNQYALQEKGWQVDVEWKQTPYGIGLFASQPIRKGQILRKGVLGNNLQQFQTLHEIETFVTSKASTDEDKDACLRYIKDYLWGFYYLNTDPRGYPFDPEKDDRFFGMWIPGNGLNHNDEPNTVYQKTTDGINLVALENIQIGEEMFDDYKRHGQYPPSWLLDFASKYPNQVDTLNFANCNEFVKFE